MLGFIQRVANAAGRLLAGASGLPIRAVKFGAGFVTSVPTDTGLTGESGNEGAIGAGEYVEAVVDTSAVVTFATVAAALAGGSSIKLGADSPALAFAIGGGTYASGTLSLGQIASVSSGTYFTAITLVNVVKDSSHVYQAAHVWRCHENGGSIVVTQDNAIGTDVNTLGGGPTIGWDYTTVDGVGYLTFGVSGIDAGTVCTGAVVAMV